MRHYDDRSDSREISGILCDVISLKNQNSASLIFQGFVCGLPAVSISLTLRIQISRVLRLYTCNFLSCILSDAEGRDNCHFGSNFIIPASVRKRERQFQGTEISVLGFVTSLYVGPFAPTSCVAF